MEKVKETWRKNNPTKTIILNPNPNATGSGDRGASETEETRWEDQILDELVKSRVNITNQHLPTRNRCMILRSHEFMEKVSANSRDVDLASK